MFNFVVVYKNGRVASGRASSLRYALENMLSVWEDTWYSKGAGVLGAYFGQDEDDAVLRGYYTKEQVQLALDAERKKAVCDA